MCSENGQSLNDLCACAVASSCLTICLMTTFLQQMDRDSYRFESSMWAVSSLWVVAETVLGQIQGSKLNALFELDS